MPATETVKTDSTGTKTVRLDRGANGLLERRIEIDRLVGHDPVTIVNPLTSLPIPTLSGTGAIGAEITYTPGTAGALAWYYADNEKVQPALSAETWRPSLAFAGREITVRETVGNNTAQSAGITVDAGGIAAADRYIAAWNDLFEDLNRARISPNGDLVSGSIYVYRDRKRWGADVAVNQEAQRFVTGTDYGFYSNPASTPLAHDPFELLMHECKIKMRAATAAELPHLDGKTHLAGCLSTQGILEKRYGIWRFRVKYDKARGLWPAIWLVRASLREPWEIDILEAHGEDNAVHLNVHRPPGNKEWYSEQDPSGFLAVAGQTDEYFDVEAHHLPDRIELYVEGVLKHTVNRVIDEPMYLLVTESLSTGNPPGFIPTWDGTTPSTIEMSLQYIQFFERPSEQALGPAINAKPVIIGNQDLVTVVADAQVTGSVADATYPIKRWESGAFVNPNTSGNTYTPEKALGPEIPYGTHPQRDHKKDVFRVEIHQDAAGNTVTIASDPIYVEKPHDYVEPAGSSFYLETFDAGVPSGAIAVNSAVMSAPNGRLRVESSGQNPSVVINIPVDVGTQYELNWESFAGHGGYNPTINVGDGVAWNTHAADVAAGPVVFTATDPTLRLEFIGHTTTSGQYHEYDNVRLDVVSGGGGGGGTGEFSATFDSDTEGFQPVSSAILSSINGRLRVANGAANFSQGVIDIPVEIGEEYRLTWDAFPGHSFFNPAIHIGTPGTWNQYAENENSGDFVFTVVGETTLRLQLNSNSPELGAYHEYDNVVLTKTSGGGGTGTAHIDAAIAGMTKLNDDTLVGVNTGITWAKSNSFIISTYPNTPTHAAVTNGAGHQTSNWAQWAKDWVLGLDANILNGPWLDLLGWCVICNGPGHTQATLTFGDYGIYGLKPDNTYDTLYEGPLTPARYADKQFIVEGPDYPTYGSLTPTSPNTVILPNESELTNRLLHPYAQKIGDVPLQNYDAVACHISMKANGGNVLAGAGSDNYPNGQNFGRIPGMFTTAFTQVGASPTWISGYTAIEARPNYISDVGVAILQARLIANPSPVPTELT